MDIEQLLKDNDWVTINAGDKVLFWGEKNELWCVSWWDEDEKNPEYEGPSFEDAIKELLK